MDSSIKIKELMYLHCENFVDSRFKTIQNSIKQIQESLSSETKSSAGDKHETGRAMLQLEREKLGHQLAEIQRIKENFYKIDITKTSKVVGLGSLVFTSNTNYFIGVSAGKLIVNNSTFYAISANTPIAQLLLTKGIGDIVQFRDTQFTIQAIH
ncbi:3-oxoacyl-ACP synthase [uncultured Algibacter sp.]|uniref:3-oxoacyl-ACP synthase n=1 Tax=uncultured Algibacter sp. TaxID=298659 RepID=UPI003216D7CE